MKTDTCKPEDHIVCSRINLFIISVVVRFFADVGWLFAAVELHSGSSTSEEDLDRFRLRLEVGISVQCSGTK